MLKYKHLQKDKNLKLVLRTLREGKLTIREIRERINNELRAEATRKYERQFYDRIINASDKDGLIENDSRGPHIRTIERSLEFLRKHGLVQKRKFAYSLTQKGRDPKYMAEDFGRFILSLLAKRVYPIFTLSENLDILIEFFGTYVILCLLEGARPPKNKVRFDLYERDKLANTWIDEVLDHEGMYRILRGVIENQRTDEEVERWIKKYKKKSGNSISFQNDDGNALILPTALDFGLEQFDYLTHTTSDPRITNRPSLEIDDKRISDVEKILNTNHYLYLSFLEGKREFYPEF